MATQTMLVRLKPYNSKRGHLLRRFTYRGVRFMEDRGWYRVDEEIAGYLRGVRQVDSDPDSPLAFDVCTEDEALEAGAGEEPSPDLTTADLPQNQGRAKASKTKAGKSSRRK